MLLLVLAIVSFVTAAEVQQTLCQKYSRALGLTQIQLMTTVVSAVVADEVADPHIRLFFDGTLPPGSTNFLNNTNAFNALAGGLIAFFGGALGCNDPGFPKYTGANMAVVHSRMPIDRDTFEKFNSIFIGTLAKLGVSAEDQGAIGGVLATFAGQIVNPRVICGKYAFALGITEVQLMSAAVTAVVKKELADPTILPFFNGQVPAGSTNFLTNATAFNRLASNLVAFFGAALGCNVNFPAYTGPKDMKALHAKMPISNIVFSNFNNNFQNALGDLGVGMGDQLTVRGILNSFSAAIVNR